MLARLALFILQFFLVKWYLALLSYVALDYLIQRLFCLVTGLTQIPHGVPAFFSRVKLETVITGTTKQKINSIDDVSAQFLRNSEQILIMRSKIVSYMNNLFLRRVTGEEL